MQSGQTRVWLQTAVFCMLQSVAFSPQQTKQNMSANKKLKRFMLNKHVVLYEHSMCHISIYLVFEVVYGNHIHHDDIISKRLQPSYTDAAVWKHSPETNLQRHESADDLNDLKKKMCSAS